MQVSTLCFESTADHRRAHDRADRRTDGRTALEDHLARIVALADHPYHLAMVHHQQRADVLFRHQAQGVEHHLVRSDGVHLLVLLGVQQLC